MRQGGNVSDDRPTGERFVSYRPGRARALGLLMSAGTLAIVWATGCVPRSDATPVTGPEPPNSLKVTASTETPAVFEGTGATFSATASGGTEPYRFRWDFNGGPIELELGTVTESSLTVDELTDPGRYVFRVVVTDDDGRHATGFVAVTVTPAVTATAPDQAIVGEPADLTATLETEAADATVLWEVTAGTATIADPAALNTTITTTTGETVDVRLSVTLPGVDDIPGATATREFQIVSVFDLHPQVLITTNYGDMTLEIDGEAAPLHMINFLLYVDAGFYDGLVFHRNACSQATEDDPCEPFVLQGGGYERIDGELVEKTPTRDPVVAEADNGLTNATVYSVSLALVGNDSGSGTTQFFINLDSDNGFLDDRDFTVFGQIVEGTDVVDTIVAQPTVDSPFLPGEPSLPAEDVIIERITRINP